MTPDAVYDLYSDLIDKHFLRGLTPAEQDELKRVEALLDSDDEAFYRPLKAALKTELERFTKAHP